MGPYKYLSPFIMFLAAWFSFNNTGLITFLPVMYAFVFIPFIELFIRPDINNLSAAEEQLAKADKTYDYILYLILPLQYLLLFTFLFSLQQNGLSTFDKAGRIISMGLLCGVFGINVAHELGHRVNKAEQWMAKALLLTSLYTHFFIEHNKGHHKHVATHEDPSSARFNESVFAFYPRTLLFTYLSAWKISNNDVRKKGKRVIGFHNEMLQLQLLQLAFVTTILFMFGWKITGAYLLSAFIGMLLLECVNYIEHYGLTRKQTENGMYERTMPHHSWNSNHVVGRLMLFELSRHSDHHYLASRKYQVLRHHDHSMQMPTGYPGMMKLGHIPPNWLYIIKKRIKKEAPVAMPLAG